MDSVVRGEERTRVSRPPKPISTRSSASGVKIRDTLSETHAGINRLRRIRRQVSEWSQRLGESAPSDGAPSTPGSGEPRPAGQDGPDVARPKAIAEAAARLLAKLSEIETELVQTSARNSMDALRLPARLNLRLASLVSVLSSADAAPPRQAYLVYEHLAEVAHRELGRLEDTHRERRRRIQHPGARGEPPGDRDSIVPSTGGTGRPARREETHGKDTRHGASDALDGHRRRARGGVQPLVRRGAPRTGSWRFRGSSRPHATWRSEAAPGT